MKLTTILNALLTDNCNEHTVEEYKQIVNDYAEIYATMNAHEDHEGALANYRLISEYDLFNIANIFGYDICGKSFRAARLTKHNTLTAALARALSGELIEALNMVDAPDDLFDDAVYCLFDLWLDNEACDVNKLDGTFLDAEALAKKATLYESGDIVSDYTGEVFCNIGARNAAMYLGTEVPEMTFPEKERADAYECVVTNGSEITTERNNLIFRLVRCVDDQFYYVEQYVVLEETIRRVLEVKFSMFDEAYTFYSTLVNNGNVVADWSAIKADCYQVCPEEGSVTRTSDEVTTFYREEQYCLFETELYDKAEIKTTVKDKVIGAHVSGRTCMIYAQDVQGKLLGAVGYTDLERAFEKYFSLGGRV